MTGRRVRRHKTVPLLRVDEDELGEPWRGRTGRVGGLGPSCFKDASGGHMKDTGNVQGIPEGLRLLGHTDSGPSSFRSLVPSPVPGGGNVSPRSLPR